jgi:hypothetical protein
MSQDTKVVTPLVLVPAEVGLPGAPTRPPVPELINKDALMSKAPDLPFETVERLQKAESNREALEIKVARLSECVGAALDIYGKFPIPDNAYQLAALNSSYNSALTQLEKMRDPKATLDEIAQVVKAKFVDVIGVLAREIDKTKREILSRYPGEKPMIEDLFGRMLEAIQPETQKTFGDMEIALKKALGFKR